MLNVLMNGTLWLFVGFSLLGVIRIVQAIRNRDRRKTEVMFWYAAAIWTMTAGCAYVVMCNPWTRESAIHARAWAVAIPLVNLIVIFRIKKLNSPATTTDAN